MSFKVGDPVRHYELDLVGVITSVRAPVNGLDLFQIRYSVLWDEWCMDESMAQKQFGGRTSGEHEETLIPLEPCEIPL